MTTELADVLGARVHDLQTTTGAAVLFLRAGDPESLELARDAAQQASDAANALAVRLVAEGVPLGRGTVEARRDAADALDLAALRSLATPTGAELLAALDALMPLAEKLDAERGRIAPAAQPGESRGTDYAEALAAIRLRLRGEVEGAAGKGWE